MATTPRFEDISRILKRLLPADYGAVLFGSQTIGGARAGSDWDIGLIGPEPLRGAVVQSIRDELEELPTLQTFDIVDLATTPEQFRQSALRGARAIVPGAALERFTEIMTMPADDEIDLTAFETALARLADALRQVKTEWTRDAAIQRFEFTFELAWKTMMHAARTEGVDSGASPKQALKAALRLGWITDDELWLGMLKDRNMTTHTYKEQVAEDIFDRLPDYQRALSELLARLKQVLEPPEKKNGDAFVED